MNEEREFDSGIVLSLATPILFADFGTVHECIEFIFDAPIFTHQLADRATVDAMRDAIVARHPQLAHLDVSDVTPQNWSEKLALLKAQVGDQFALTRGMVRNQRPSFEAGLSSDKPITVIIV